jgi:type II secretory pathway pseudopilin PulG
MTSRPRDSGPDSGAALILAIGFMLMVGIISGALAGFATNSVRNQAKLELVRNREYAADGAIEQAIALVGGAPGTYPATCSLGGQIPTDAPNTNFTLNQVSIRVDWLNACRDVQSSDGTKVDQHNVIFTASCMTPTDLICNSTAVIIRAQVNFQLNPPRTYVQSWSVNR